MSFHKFTDKHRQWDAMWFALGDETPKSVFKRQYKVKITRRLDQEALDNKQEQHKQLYLHKLNNICSDLVTFPDTSSSRWDHLRKELDATNAYFFRKLSPECYEFQTSLDFHNYRHDRLLKESLIKTYPVLGQFKKPYYDIVQIYNRTGKLLYFLVQNGSPFSIAHKSAAKTPFGNNEFCPDQVLRADILNYFVVSLYSEVIIKISSNDLNSGGIIPVYCGKFRIGRIHLNTFGELLLMSETVHPGNTSHDYIVKCKPCSTEVTKYIFRVHEISTMNIIATITCKLWKDLTSEIINGSRMFGLCFKQNVTILDKTLIFGAAIIIVHEFYRILWSGNLDKPKRLVLCGKKQDVVTENDFKYTVPQMPSPQPILKNDFIYNKS